MIQSHKVQGVIMLPAEISDMVDETYTRGTCGNGGSMIKDRNIFIEGIQGMGKSTLLQAIAHRLFADVPQEGFLLLYLYDEHLEESTRIICEERADDQGNPFWYPLMLDYLKSSPYGKAHGYQGFDDLIRHFRHRQQLELRILREVVGHRAVILPAKRWDIEKVLDIIEG